MVKSLILFLSGLLILLQGCTQSSPLKGSIDCADKHLQDSLLKKYIDSGADRLPYFYNSTAWQLYCDSVIAICPNIAAAWQLKGVPHIKNGMYEKAFAFNDRAAEIDPRQFMAYRAFLKCIFTKDYEGALVDFGKARQLTPDGYEMDHTYRFYEGLCNLELGNYAAAEKNLQQDIFIQTGGDTAKTVHYNTLLYMGILYYEMKKDVQAKKYLGKCLKDYEQLPEANYYLAMVCQREGDDPLKKKYLAIARQSYIDKYKMNEDNLFYVNYPHQITLYEIEQAARP